MRGSLFVLLLMLGGGARALEPVTLQLNWKHQFQFAGYYAAVAQGYYRDAGFEVSLAEVRDGVEPIDAVLRGEAQFGVGASELALRRAQGQPLVALATILQHSPLVLLANAREADSIHDLAGRRLMLLAHETELYAYLNKEGIPLAALQVVPHSFDPRDLIEGRVEAISAYQTDEPFLLRQAGFRYATFNPRSSGVDFYGDSLFTSEDMVRRRPGTVRAFREASLKGWRYAMAHPAEIADLIRARYSTRHSREHLLFEAAEMARLMQPDLVEIGHMSPGRWQHIADTYAELGMLPAGTVLEGFLFETRPRELPAWIIPTLLAAGLALLVLAAAAWRYLRLSRRLAQESAARQDLLHQLHATQRDMGALIDATPGAAMLLDAAGTILAMNEAGANRFQVAKGEITGRNIFDLSPEDIRETRRQATTRAMAEKRCIVLADQRAGRLLRNTLVPVEDEDGQVRRIAVFSEDVTERHQAEEALRASEERYRLLLEAAPFPVIITRIADATVVYLNRRAALRFAIAQEEAVGRKAPDYWQEPEERARLVAELARQGMVSDREVGLKTARGEPFWVYLSAALIRQGEETLAFVAFADITERRQAEQAMREAHGQLQEQLAEIRLLQERLAEMAIRDPLTGLYNRRYLDETLEREIARARREGYPLSLVMIDVDHFKAINDTYGHQAGDEVLRTLASQLRDQVRAEDVPCRYGGEEFLVLLPKMPLAAACERAEAWRRELAARTIGFGRFELANTASFGVASYPEHGKNPDELTRCADRALYLAKARGRDRVVAYSAES